jgi:hypothetical protein
MRDNDWLDPQWRAAAETWMREHLDAPAQGPIEQVRAVPWSVTLRAQTANGPRWFKANTMDCAYEATLAGLLGGWLPDAVLRPFATDPERGWMLTEDAGPTLREINPGENKEKMLHAYAQLQRTVSDRAAELIAAGVPDQRVPLMPGHLASLLADNRVRADLGPERLQSVEAMVPAFGDWCAELAADGIAASLQHDDLHDNNVFPNGRGGYRFFDWGDASVAHPFGVLLVALNAVEHSGEDADTARLRDAYLEPWSDLGTRKALLRSASLARKVTVASRALSWQRALRDAAIEVPPHFRTAVADWLAELPAEGVQDG